MNRNMLMAVTVTAIGSALGALIYRKYLENR